MKYIENRKKIKTFAIIIIFLLIAIIAFCTLTFMKKNKSNNKTIKEVKTTIVDLNSLKFNDKNIERYTQDDFEKFKNNYSNNFLGDIYITEFLFDGVGMYKPYDLDDFIENGNDYEIEPLEITVININTTGNVELSGDITGMIAINSNVLSDDVNLILNNVKIDTDSKKVPAIYVYNKDITSTTSKVTIVAKEGTKNYIEGGKLKKVSLIPTDDLDSYSSKYTGNNANNYSNYSNYYGVYSKNDLNKILFAKITADNEELNDGDPYYYYKASGAISSDIDLYFEGSGYLEVTSKNKEGIETKGNLEFSGGIGDYVIYAFDDCLNTTTKSSITNARNTLTIDVNSLTAIVSNDALEGDAIDSNGVLNLNGGTIIAIAKPGSDAGIDSETGTYINSGTLIATGDMIDSISSNSKQKYVILSFIEKPVENSLITLLDSKENVIMSYQTDREYTNLVYSSNKLVNGTYSLFKDGNIVGTEKNGFYTKVSSYDKGLQLGYINTGIFNEMGNTMMPNKNNCENPPEKPDMNRRLDDERIIPNDNNIPEMQNNMELNTSQVITNKDFTINGTSNRFNGIGALTE